MIKGGLSYMLNPSLYSIKIIRENYCLVKRVENCYPIQFYIMANSIIEKPIKQLYFEICTGYFKSSNDLEYTIFERNIERGFPL